MAHHAELTALATTMTNNGVTPVVLLESREEILPIFITPEQAEAIGMALEDYPFDRPLTHDLLVTILDDFGGTVTQVRIDDVVDGTFYAKIDLEQADGTKHVFDARPSDALAVAVRVDCDIHVTDAVLDQAGRDTDAIRIEDDVPPSPTDEAVDYDLDKLDDEDMPPSDESDLDDPPIDDFEVDDPFLDEDSDTSR